MSLTETEREEKRIYVAQMDEKAQKLGYENYAEQRKAIALESRKRIQEDLKKTEKTRSEIYSRQNEEQEEIAKSLGFKSYEDQYKQQLLKKVENKAGKDVFSGEKIVVPPPYVKKVEALEFTQNSRPGEIVIDTSGKLLLRYFEYEGRIGSLIDQYNNFITYGLGNQIFSRNLKLDTGVVTFENIQLNRPMIKSVEDRMVPLYPQKARNSGYSYTADIYVDMVLNKGLQNEERLDKTFLGKIPVMLGSELDWVTRMSEEERVKRGESINEAFGYFIIKGTEKIVMIQEKLRANRIFVFNSSSKGDIVCKVTNNTLSGSTQITLAKGKKSGAIKVHLGFLGRLGSTNKLGRTISVFQIFRMLGVKTENMIDFVQLFANKAYKKKIFVALQPSIVKLTKIGDDIEYISKKKGLGDLPYEIRKKDIMKDLFNQLFPQVDETQVNIKLYMLSMMIARLVEYFVGARELDDRDNWSNKQLVTAGKSLELLFASIWREAIDNAQTEIEEKKLAGLKAAQKAINVSTITDNFIESFSPNNWGVQSSYLTKENITDILKRDSILSVYSHLGKINTPSSSKVKSSKIRMVQMSQLGYVDAAETPEGELCLAQSTPVLMGNGTWKAIGEIVVGDCVVTVNPHTFERTASVISNPFTFLSSDKEKVMYRLTTTDDLYSIEGTGDHPFLTQYGWISLDKLNPDLDKVCIMKDNAFYYQKIRSIEIIPPASVSDFTTVSSNHSFIAGGFVVHNCGLTKNTAMTAYMSLDRPEEIVEELVGKYVSNVPSMETINPFILNGVFKGWVNGKELKDFCVTLKRGMKLPKDTAIVLERDGYFNIYTDACRPTRPLLVVDERGELVIAVKNLWDADFETLLREGCVEYVDAWEQDNIMLAQHISDIDFRKRDLDMARKLLVEAQTKYSSGSQNSEAKYIPEMISQAEEALKEILDQPKYTHSEMDPSAIMSIAVGVIPLPETNPGPRLTYQSGMGKQALGIYHSNHANRFDTTSKVLAYPTRPMFETQMNSVIGLDELPAGDTVLLAITTYTGFAQEDAIVMAQGAIDRGLFRSIIYKTYKNVRKNKTKNFHEEFSRPEIKPEESDRYSAIDENGIPIMGSFVKEGDCLIGKVRKNFLTGKTENVSSFVEIKQEGVVDRVLVSSNAEGELVCKVKIRQVRKPVIGDKYACYSPDHEVLTFERGWVKISELSLNDKVATLSEGEELIYEKPIELQSYDFEGDLYCVEGENIDLQVTKNHRMYVNHEGEWKILLAEEIFEKRVEFKRDAEYFPENVESFRDLHINDSLPAWCFSLSQENSRRLCKSIFTKNEFRTTYMQLANDVSQLVLHAGSMSKIEKKGDEFIVKLITISSEKYVEKFTPYMGKVYCCTVRSGIIYVRRNGKAVWCGNSRYAQKGTIGMILPDEDMPFMADGRRPDILINSHCFVRDTPVSSHAGYSKRIGDFTAEGGEKVWCWDEEHKTYTISTSAGMESKGIRDVVNVFLEDGRVIKCTPDHRFLTSTNMGNDRYEYAWVEAKDLKTSRLSGNMRIGGSKILCGLEIPLDKPELDVGSSWSLTSADYTFDMSTPLNREKALAFARLLGYTLTDGCISKREDVTHGFVSTLNMGHNVDAKCVQDDILMITGRMMSYREDKGTVNIRLPASLAGAMGKLDGVQSGKRVDQDVTFPTFLDDPNCPLSVIREFLGGLYGGDGICPHVATRKDTTQVPLIVETCFGQSTKEEFKDSLKAKMEHLERLLKRVGVDCSRIDGPYLRKLSPNSFDSQDGIPRYNAVLHTKNNSDFGTKVGFRYCIQKACRMSAALAYLRYQEEIARQHDWVVNRTKELYVNRATSPVKDVLKRVQDELKAREPILNDFYSLSNLTDVRNRMNTGGGSANTLSKFLYNDKSKMMSVKQFFKKIGCLHWFERVDASKQDYIVKRGSIEIPGFHIEVVGVRLAGQEEVFDIGVNNQHNFLAHGALAHNCMPSRMTIGKMIEIVSSKVAAFTGERVNATAFRRFDVKEFMRNLKQYGYSGSGSERMYSGYTGKPLEAMIFNGPCYYQALRHQVVDKIQMRARGGVSQLTHQPVAGRKRGGGLRIGEMERDAIISHGASAFLRERLCLVSDAYETVYCSTCGMMAIANIQEDTYICRNCDENAAFGKCTIPYAYKLLTQLLLGAGISTKFRMEEGKK
jgi:DNA-directed RNA polymerase beta subunit/intein/homing endonuclease